MDGNGRNSYGSNNDESEKGEKWKGINILPRVVTSNLSAVVAPVVHGFFMHRVNVGRRN